MIEVKNKGRSPVQLTIRSKKAPRAFTTLNIPGIGNQKNVILLEDERVIPEIIERVEKLGLISTRYVPNKRVEKGD
jgi:hypothetical protein